MCRSIKTLRRPAQPPTEEELRAAALQFVRKVSGYRTPSQANRQAFDDAVADIAQATRAMFDKLKTSEASPRALRPQGSHTGRNSRAGLSVNRTVPPVENP